MRLDASCLIRGQLSDSTISADSSSVADSTLSHVIHSLKNYIIFYDDENNLQEFSYYDSYMSRF